MLCGTAYLVVTPQLRRFLYCLTQNIRAAPIRTLPRKDDLVRLFLFSFLLSITLLSHGVAQEVEAKAQLQLEVRIPDQLVMYFEQERSGNAGLSLAGRGSSATIKTVFDLTCATLGALPGRCHSLYGGALLDTEGRPYPPADVNASGKVVGPGSFPQFFEAPTRTLRVYTPARRWQVQVEMLNDSTLTADNFSVFSSVNGWRCLGYHPDWLTVATETCLTSTDASRASVTVVDAPNSKGGWHDITLGLKLRLDGSEAAGSYDSVLRYTLVTF